MLHNHQYVSHIGQRSGEPDLSHKKSRNVLILSHVTQDQKAHGGVHKHLCTSPGSSNPYPWICLLHRYHHYEPAKTKHSWVERTSRWTGTRYANISLDRQTDRSFLGKKTSKARNKIQSSPKG